MGTYLPTSDFYPSTVGWFYPYDSILQPIFDRYLLELFESGVYERIKNTKMDIQQTACQIEPVVEVGFPFVMVIFFILIGGVSLSLLIFVLEKNGIDFLKKEIRWP